MFNGYLYAFFGSVADTIKRLHNVLLLLRPTLFGLHTKIPLKMRV
jgi:hypothetical protein